jgi:hypothetical protein
MLSYRSLSLEDPDRSSISYLRSNLSAARVITIVKTEFGTTLSNFPFVPYAVSLALRVSYRELRFSKVPLHRSMARSQLLIVCALLEEYGCRFTFAQRLAALAAKTVRELDKVAALVLQARHNGANLIGSTQLSAREDRPLDTIPKRFDANSSALYAQQDVNTSNVATNNSAFPKLPPVGQHIASEYSAESFDVVYNIADLPNCFEYFDPEFNLGAIDCALAQNVRATDLPGFGLDPDMNWILGEEVRSVLPNSAGNEELSSGTAW